MKLRWESMTNPKDISAFMGMTTHLKVKVTMSGKGKYRGQERKEQCEIYPDLIIPVHELA